MLAPVDARAEKSRLRRSYREARRAVSPEVAVRNAALLAAHAAGCPEIVGARTVLGYVASDGEIDVGQALGAASRAGATVLLPRLDRGDHATRALELVRWVPGGDLAATGPGGTLEPPGEAVDLHRDTLPAPACALVPAVALARGGARLGRGGGHYDRLLPELRARGWFLVGVCHAAEIVGTLPTEAHDVGVDAILTELNYRRVAHGPTGR